MITFVTIYLAIGIYNVIWTCYLYDLERSTDSVLILLLFWPIVDIWHIADLITGKINDHYNVDN